MAQPNLSRRAILKTALIGGIVPLVAACSASQSSTPTPAPTAASTAKPTAAPTKATPAAQAATSAGGTVQFLLIGATTDLLNIFNKTIIPAFTAQTKGKLELQTTDWGSAFQKITTAAAAGTTPDTLTVGGIWTAPLAAKGALQAIDQYTSKWADQAQFYPGIWKDAIYNGKTYCVPYNSDARTVTFRTDFFQEVGLDPKKPPTTWDEYKAAATKLVKKNGSQIAREGADWAIDTSIGLQQVFAQILFQAGGTYYKSDGKANFNSPEGVKALDWLVSFFKEGLSSVNIVNRPNAPTALVSGSGAMTYANYGTVTNALSMDKAVAPKLDAGLPLRSAPDKPQVTCAWINKYGMGATTKLPDLAWQWIALISSAKYVAPQLEVSGLTPARKDLADASFMKSRNPNFLNAAQFVVPQPARPQMLQIVQVINQKLQGAIYLKTTTEETLTAIDQEVDKVNSAS